VSSVFLSFQSYSSPPCSFAYTLHSTSRSGQERGLFFVVFPFQIPGHHRDAKSASAMVVWLPPTVRLPPKHVSVPSRYTEECHAAVLIYAAHISNIYHFSACSQVAVGKTGPPGNFSVVKGINGKFGVDEVKPVCDWSGNLVRRQSAVTFHCPLPLQFRFVPIVTAHWPRTAASPHHHSRLPAALRNRFRPAFKRSIALS
jgi:hypothetical protein